ncbi:hypothetical protein IPZ58_03040 [Streptomyces roseoverticillatus]|uniref:hypothetical protein n=1 Tax=Streptomyces roseoverticillatus TaxID=66429 RepID=UPI001F2EE8D5|nr:hypothetical protein [Streptomyces roseoverticillatus]MCF3100553.1 hypothetical protein [Streptomyces roseoverticillatus]
MPTPYGSRGGMAFSADELRVLRRALAIALHPHAVPGRPGPERAAEVRDCFRLAEAVDEAALESGRLRAFLRADLARYRAALPGAASGYAARLQDALAAGYRPRAEDLDALRALSAAPSAGPAGAAYRALLRRCELASGRAAADRTACAVPAARIRLRRTPLLALPGGRPPSAGASAPRPGQKPGQKPAEKPAGKPGGEPGKPSAPRPDRPIPTPGEAFPPRRKPAPPPSAEAPHARPA